MEENQKPHVFPTPSVGRIIHFYPGSKDKKLPNGMEFAPAIVTQYWENDQGVLNAVGFVSPRPDQEWPEPYFPIWSAHYGKEEQTVGDETWYNGYWIWPPNVITKPRG